eukprot:2234073-Alexandrium_andersonii.AAC.1
MITLLYLLCLKARCPPVRLTLALLCLLCLKAGRQSCPARARTGDPGSGCAAGCPGSAPGPISNAAM